jgi:uncharacterized protein involved in oxidation of intracellular sulfur
MPIDHVRNSEATMRTTLLGLNDAPYRTGRTSNALRLAGTLAETRGNDVRVFLLGDAVGSTRTNQKVPSANYYVGVTLNAVIHHGGKAAICGTWLDPRGIGETELVAGAQPGTMSHIAGWTATVDRVPPLLLCTRAVAAAEHWGCGDV